MASSLKAMSIENLSWKKVGKIFDPAELGSSLSHAQVPFPIQVGPHTRVFYSTRFPRDVQGLFKSHVRWVDLDLGNPDIPKVIAHSEGPVLTPGREGAFDDSGVMLGSIVQFKDENYVYFTGWSRGDPTPYSLSIGLIKARDTDGSLDRDAEGPILGRSQRDPFVQSHPIVFRSEEQWFMIYQSGYDWLDTQGRWESLYRLRMAYSENGVQWSPGEPNLVPQVSSDECQTSPTLLRTSDGWLMYFAYRRGLDFRGNSSGAYRIGAAFSKDMRSWQRIMDPLSLGPSAAGWDSEMVCYPRFLEVDGKLGVLYCGNNFGKDGFGLAVCEEFLGWSVVV